VRTIATPPSGGPLQRSVAACLAAILEVEAADVPVPETAHPAPWTVWREWLAERGMGLVPIAEPRSFNWPGPWLAVLRDETAAAVAFGSPPGLAWQPLGSGASFADVESGYVVAPADVALWAPKGEAATHADGAVEALLVAPDPEAPMVRVGRADVTAGRGLEGDRYFDGRGTFSDAHGRGHDLTLVEAEALEELGFSPEEARRNVVTRGVALNALVGERFRIGSVECVGARLCEPCAHLERITGRPGTLRALIHRGGLRADVLADGELQVGDLLSRGA